MLDDIVYVGTYTRSLPHVDGKAEGIYSCRFDRQNGSLEIIGTAQGVENPSFLTLDPRRRFLYAVEETDTYGDAPGGAISAFAIDPSNGALTFINRQLTHGATPCYVSITPNGRWALVANYMGGNISVLPISEDGSLAPASAVVQHTGPAPIRDGSHPHAIRSDPAGNFILVSDLGMNRIVVYTLNEASGALTANPNESEIAADQAGPRHMTFSPDGRLLYCINEVNLTVTVYAYDREAGTLHAVQTVPTLPATAAGSSGNSCADLHLHPSGRFLYGSNRGHDSIATFAVGDDGLLTPIGHTSTGGSTPRNFAVDPQGEFLLAANQNSSTIVTLRIDPAQGLPQPTGIVAQVPTPVCVQFATG
ncbi:MAG TPA: lactonase family protein [Roseiflexaceae bacterium]|nr:lactonase family protein [Roseiflexaceae bacterium]HMP41201.1 lactonase family protein [Roseiflexaceae bacterium]